MKITVSTGELNEIAPHSLQWPLKKQPSHLIIILAPMSGVPG
jgi:hypothetical protein